LRQAERKGKWTRDRGEIDPRNFFLPMVERQSVQAKAQSNEAIGQSHCFERLQGARKDRQRPGSLRPLRGAIDDAAAHAVTCQLVSYR